MIHDEDNDEIQKTEKTEKTDLKANLIAFLILEDFVKQMLKSILATASTSIAFLGISLGAHASDIYLGMPGFAGSGCPAGSASVTLSPDAQELSILFDSYIVEAGGMTGKTIDRKNCNLAIPVHIPQGYSVALIEVDYRGFNSIPAYSSSRFTASYFFAGSTGPTQTKTWSAGVEGDYLLESNLTAASLVWSRCGDAVILRASTSLYVRSSNYYEEALSTLDSADISAGLVYHLKWRSC